MLGLLGELIFQYTYDCREFGLGLVIKTAQTLTLRGLIFGSAFKRFGGLIFWEGFFCGGTYYQNFMVQWNPDITMYQGTGMITSLYQGIIIDESMI